MDSPSGGYLTYIGREGCSGCNVFKQKILPSLINSLPSNVTLVQVIQPSSDSMSSPLPGYSRLSKARPAIEFPMLAWSQEHPSSNTANYDFLTAQKMGSVNNIINWLRDRIPPEQPTFVPQPASSLFSSTLNQPPVNGSLFTPATSSNTGSVFFGRYY